MGFSAGKILKGFFQKGFKIGYSTGKPFDPAYQVRTDPYDDFKKARQKKGENNGDNESVGKVEPETV